MTITKDDLARAVSENDALVAECYDFDKVIRDTFGVDVKAMAYVSEQRALRLIVSMRGQDALAKMMITGTVCLSKKEQTLLSQLATAWVDGFAAGIRINKEEMIDN